jgi:CHAD domain-containing protein
MRGDVVGKNKKNELIGIFKSALQAIEEPLDRIISLDDDIEAVHQYRVKIRQLRSLITFFKPKLDTALVDEINQRLKRSATVFSSVRELDVLADRWLKLADESKSEHHDFTQRLLSAKRQARIDAYVLFSPRVAKEDLCWINDRLDDLFEDDRKLTDFIDRRLNRWIKSIRKDIRRLDIEDYPAMHELRIRIKRLRYALTLLQEQVDEKLTDKVRPSKQWAEQLGIMCDFQRSKEILNEICIRDTEPKADFIQSLKVEAEETLAQLKQIEL